MCLIVLQQLLGLLQAILDPLGLGAQHRRMRFGLAQGQRERQVELVIGEAHRGLRQALLFRAAGQLCQALRGDQSCFVNR